MNTGTSGLIKAIQTGRRKLGLSDEEYRALLEGVSGKTSTKELNAYQLKEVLRRMREAGFHTAAEPQLRKIRSLWFMMYDEKIVRSKSNRSIAAYVRRITGKAVDDCSVMDFQKVIETLKQWIERMDEPTVRERLIRAFISEEPATAAIQ